MSSFSDTDLSLAKGDAVPLVQTKKKRVTFCEIARKYSDSGDERVSKTKVKRRILERPLKRELRKCSSQLIFCKELIGVALEKQKSKIKRVQSCHEKLPKGKKIEEFAFKCSKCDFETKFKRSYALHLTCCHGGSVSFQCDYCNFQTKYEKRLDKHFNANHRQLFKCPQCRFQTESKPLLIRHVTVLHGISQEKKISIFKCNRCPFITKNCKTLAHHKLSHTKIDEFIFFTCTKCSFSSGDKRLAEIHKSVHKESLVKKFKCCVCGFESILANPFRKHLIEKHKGYKKTCTRCGSLTKTDLV